MHAPIESGEEGWSKVWDLHAPPHLKLLEKMGLGILGISYFELKLKWVP